MNIVRPPSEISKKDATPRVSFTSWMKSDCLSPSTCIAISHAYRFTPSAVAASTSSSNVATLFFFIKKRKILGPNPKKLKRLVGVDESPPIRTPKIFVRKLFPTKLLPFFCLIASNPQNVKNMLTSSLHSMKTKDQLFQVISLII